VLLGRAVDWKDQLASKKIMEDALETQLDELFDMRHSSPLYAGMKLENGQAKMMNPKDIKVVRGDQRATPNMGDIRRLADLNRVGVDHLEGLVVESAHVENGKLAMRLDVPALDKSISNRVLTDQLKDIAVHDAKNRDEKKWTPMTTNWQDVGDFMKDITEFNDPVQGALGDCWLIAALTAVAWSLPYEIVHRTRATQPSGDKEHMNQLRFYKKGYGRDGRNNNPVEVTDKCVVANGTTNLVYARSRDMGEVWPAVYEKAFARWTGPVDSDQPNMASLAGGDPALATAQITNRKPVYYATASRDPSALWGIVRAHCRSYKTFDPMTAWTYATGQQYTYGSGIAANHAYTILGWAFRNNKMYIVLRNPWGFFEPSGGNTYNGVLQFLDESFWRPIDMVPNDGVFAIEATSFKEYFAYIGLAV